MINEITGFDAGGNSKSNEEARSPDPHVRDPAIARLKEAIQNMSPSLEEKKDIIYNFKRDGGGANNVVQVCAVCGSQDKQIHLEANTFSLHLLLNFDYVLFN